MHWLLGQGTSAIIGLRLSGLLKALTKPYTNPILRSLDAGEGFCGYNPFDHYHYFVPEVDEDYTDPYPDCIWPLRFIPDDLYKWEAELGTNNQDTHRLYRVEDIDGSSNA